jgi:phosphoglycerol transferase MdoB-like AlkP superfamily enzyme
LLATIALVIFTGFRAWLFNERASDLKEFSLSQCLKLFWVGFRLDGVMVSRATLLPITALFLLPEKWIEVIQPAFLVYAGILFFLVFLFEIAGVYFFHYYDFRPNHLVLEHGSDPEVLRTVVSVYPVTRILLLTIMGATICLLIVWYLAPLDFSMSAFAATGYSGLWDHLGVFLIILLAAFASRGTTGRRPLNPSAASVTANRIANEIASSGIFTVLYEWGQHVQGQYPDLASVVRTLPLEEATRRSREYFAAQGPLTDDSPNPLVRLIQDKERDSPLNVVVVVMESFTSRLVGTLGGSPGLTPELDLLASEGIIFENCYATGERTIQALEAAVSSFPPLPGAGVVRRPQARQNFTTLASLLKERGYSTPFFYGGQGIFDHMRAFFLGNGFDNFIEEKDFEDVVFRGAWGVSDEDLFRRADREFRELDSQRKISRTSCFAELGVSPTKIYSAGQIGSSESSTVKGTLSLRRFLPSRCTHPGSIQKGASILSRLIPRSRRVSSTRSLIIFSTPITRSDSSSEKHERHPISTIHYSFFWATTGCIFADATSFPSMSTAFLYSSSLHGTSCPSGFSA